MNKILQSDIQTFAQRFQHADALRNKTIMVTGATGLIGSCTVFCLLELNRCRQLGLHVVAVVRSRDKAKVLFGDEDDVLSFCVCDFANITAFHPLQKADFLIHLASPTASRFFLDHPAETLRTALNGTQVVLDYARGQALSGMVFVSSLEAYGQIYDDSEPITEDRQGYVDPMDARSSYPTAKRAAEALCHAYACEYGVKVCVARLAQTFGAGVSPDDGRVFAHFARSVIRHEDIILHTTGELSRCYCYTTDAVAALLLLMLKGEAGAAYNVAREDSYISIRDMAQFVCNAFNPGCQPVVQLQEGMGYSPVTRLRLSTARLCALGWQAHYSLHDMFQRLILSMQEDIV